METRNLLKSPPKRTRAKALLHLFGGDSIYCLVLFFNLYRSVLSGFDLSLYCCDEIC